MLRRILLATFISMLVPATLWGSDPGRRYITVQTTDNRPAPPLSAGVAAGGAFYVSGQLGTDPVTRKLGADVESEARLAMQAVERTLQQADLSTDDLVSVTVYCTDLSLFDQFNTVYRTFFHGNYPARAFIGVKDLLLGAHFEISGIAVGSPTKKPTKH